MRYECHDCMKRMENRKPSDPSSSKNQLVNDDHCIDDDERYFPSPVSIHRRTRKERWGNVLRITVRTLAIRFIVFALTLVVS